MWPKTVPLEQITHLHIALVKSAINIAFSINGDSNYTVSKAVGPSKTHSEKILTIFNLFPVPIIALNCIPAPVTSPRTCNCRFVLNNLKFNISHAFCSLVPITSQCTCICRFVFTVSHAEHFQPHLQGLLLPAPGKVGYSFPIDYCPCQPEQWSLNVTVAIMVKDTLTTSGVTESKSTHT